MKSYLRKATDKVNGLSLRERIIFALLSAASVFAVTNYLVVVPVEVKMAALEKQIAASQKGLKEAKAALKEVDSKPDPKKKLQLRESQLDEKLRLANNDLQTYKKKIVPKEDVPQWVESLLPKNTKVALEGIETLAVEPLTEGDKTTGGSGKAKLYRHMMSVSLRGTYEDLTVYMQALEKLDIQVNWVNAVLDGKNSPSCALTLTFYTISTDDKWIQL